jgi:hypothetical protein
MAGENQLIELLMFDNADDRGASGPALWLVGEGAHWPRGANRGIPDE